MFYYLIIYYQTFKENLIRQNQLAIKLQEQELSNLKAQINPHFLFNSLNSISYLIFNDPESAHHSIVQLSDYFRYSLSGTKQQFTSLEKELENIQRYLEIEKIRFDDKMRIHFEVAEQAQSVNVPILILQPLVENSIKHGVYESIEIIQIDIIIKYFEDFIQININNNFDKETKSKKGTGIGLENVRQRLELLYKRADLMKITKTENTFEVQLSIPKIQ
jgi:LytS/YehU family sensor histidine kinase